MAFLRSFTIDTDKQHPFPYNIPAVKYARDIKLDSRLTIFVGDNGSGKSTLLESIAFFLKIPLIGGHKYPKAGFEAAQILRSCIKVDWQRQTSKGFFFRAEDFSDFIDQVEKDKARIARDLFDLQGQVDDRIIAQMSDSMNYSLHEMRKQYGDNMQAYSHGEAFLTILETRILDKGIFLLDEPEAALSPLKQLSLMAFIMEALKNNNTQFILATHSPILMGFPGATIYQIREEGMEAVPYKETDHYRVTKTFLDNPEFYLRHLR